MNRSANTFIRTNPFSSLLKSGAHKMNEMDHGLSVSSESSQGKVELTLLRVLGSFVSIDPSLSQSDFQGPSFASFSSLASNCQDFLRLGRRTL